MDYEQISYESGEGIATITLDRPDKLNAFTWRMRDELIHAFDRTDADDDVRVVIVTGRGRGFCAGADLSAGGGTFDNRVRGGADRMEDHRDGGGQVALRVFRSLKPVIAAINGPAVGVGITMTLPMDVRLASDDARIGFVFAKRGIVLEACSTWFLPRLVGISRAAEWGYTGRLFDAKEALEAGLVRSIHPPHALLPAARDLAREIADNTSAVAVALNRQMLWRMLGASGPEDAHRVDSMAMFCMGRSDDAREGVQSFLDKRPAAFPMKVSRDMPPFFPWDESGSGQD
ncbi:MAG TPA: crotonase/enoyl-CoA hydratase family protein [Actinomycetota bacterium]|nr:crotonase/enoyl-CoA hydratase family protein [Actinomycetota bacterium]